MIELGVNVDHVATVRQARQTYEPDPVWAAVEAHLGGADGITVHLREDRRHIQDEDVRRLRELTHIKLNLEMAATDEMIDVARRVRPEMAMLVPEGRHEITTEGGLDIAAQIECARVDHVVFVFRLEEVDVGERLLEFIDGVVADRAVEQGERAQRVVGVFAEPRVEQFRGVQMDEDLENRQRNGLSEIDNRRTLTVPATAVQPSAIRIQWIARELGLGEPQALGITLRCRVPAGQ